MEKRINLLPGFQKDYVPNIVLLGNGITMVEGSNSSESWDDFLNDIADISFKGRIDDIKDMPYPLRPVVVTGDSIDVKLEKKAMDLLPHGLSAKHREFIQRFTNLPLDAILTTNYTYEIEQAIFPEFSCNYKRPCKYRKTSVDGRRPEEQFGVFKYYSLPSNNKDSIVWHIHGEAARPNSMVLGHYYYGNLLSVIQQNIPKLIAHISICEKKNIPIQPRSWIDYFMLGNVYIAGFGLDYSEMDIWWMINCKSRRFSNHGKVVFYEPKCREAGYKSKCGLAQAYKMEMPDLNFTGDYTKYYEAVIQDISNRIH